jgi:hypothetical protein
MEVARNMLHHSGLGPKIWAKVMNIATYFKAKCPMA